MGNAQYKNLIPASLFLVLNDFNFKTYNMVNSKPIVFGENGHTYNWGIWPSRSTTPTPGGINFEDLNTTLQNVLLS
jgi:hypothetical protein